MTTIRRLASIAALALLGAACSTNGAGLSVRGDAATDGPASGAGGAPTGTGGRSGSGGTTGPATGTGGSTIGVGGTVGGSGGSGQGGSGTGGVAATGGIGTGGRITGTGGAGGARTGSGGVETGGRLGTGGAGTGGRLGTGGEAQRSGGSSGTSKGGNTGLGGAGNGGIPGTGGTTIRGTGGAGSGGTGGTSTAPTCGGATCASNEFCCGPTDCGHCANDLTGPNCPQACGTSACGPSGAPCQTGEICLNVNVSMGPRNTIATKCIANPCGTQTLACACAGTVCQDANPIVQCSQAQANIGALICVGGGVCASPDTPIATPTGNRPIADLRRGDLVFSEHHGAIVAVPLLEVVRRPVQGHVVVRIVTASGATLAISAPHPTADGRRFADLQVGDLLDGDRILSREVVGYPHAFTYDILPASSTGTYLANGHLIGTTLRP